MKIWKRVLQGSFKTRTCLQFKNLLVFLKRTQRVRVTPINMRRKRIIRHSLRTRCNKTLFTWCCQTAEECQIFLSMIRFISLGKTTDASRISSAQSAGTQSKSFVPPPQSGVSDGCTEGCAPHTHTHGRTFILRKTVISPPLPLILFIPFSGFVLVGVVWCLGLWCPAHLYLFRLFDLSLCVTGIFIPTLNFIFFFLPSHSFVGRCVCEKPA